MQLGERRLCGPGERQDATGAVWHGSSACFLSRSESMARGATTRGSQSGGMALALARTGWRIAAGFLLALVALTAFPLQVGAQTDITLVSNIGRDDASGSATISNEDVHAQQFTTGSHEGRYSLSRVVVNIRSGTMATPAFALHESTTDSNNRAVPGDKIVDLSGSVATAGRQSFTPSSLTTLTASTKYFAVFKTTTSTQAKLVRTASNYIDSNPQPGWDIADDGTFSGNSGTSWSSDSRAIEIAIHGLLPPVRPVSLFVNLGKLRLTYVQRLAEGSTPAASAYTVMVDGMAVSVTNVAVRHGTVELTLMETVMEGQTVTVTYEKPATNPLRYRDGTSHAAALTDEPVTNLTERCDESLGLGRVARDGDACVILDSIIVKVASGYTVDEAAEALEQLEGWTVTSRLCQLGMIGGEYTPDTLTLAQLDAKRDEIQALPWAARVGRDLVARAANAPATGTPAISGSAQVGQTLTADTAGIADADGLTNVSYRYQWLAHDGNADSAIEGATDSTYTVQATDVGKTIKFRVTFTDDAGNDEALTSTGLGPVTLGDGGGGSPSESSTGTSGTEGSTGGNSSTGGSSGRTGGNSSTGGGSRGSSTGSEGYLENPGPDSFQSGIGVISGWVCDAETVEIVVEDTEHHIAAYGTERADTEAVCGDTDNGFGLLFNWNRLGDGTYTVVVLVDAVELGRATVTVTTLGQEFAKDLPAAACTVEDWPSPGETVTLEWQQHQQNFVITDIE